MKEFRDIITKEAIIDKEVNVEYEVAKYLKMYKNRTVFFEKISGYDEFKIVGNVFISKERLIEALGVKNFCKDIIAKENERGEILYRKDYERRELKSLYELPILKHFERDAGRYITSGVVIAYDKKYGRNASIHRLLVIDENHLAIRLVERDLYKYYIEREREGKPLEVVICIGVNPYVLFSACYSLEINKDEIEFASSLAGKLYLTEAKTVNLDYPIDSEIVIEGEILPRERVFEGPFVDITRTYDVKRLQPVIKVKRIAVRKNPIYYAILPGGYEHQVLMGVVKEPKIYKEVSKYCDVKDVSTTKGSMHYFHCIISIRKKRQEDVLNAIKAAFNAHKGLKLVIVVDDDIDVNCWEDIEYALATRFQADKDLYIFKNQPGSSLDPSAEKSGITSKLGIDATMPLNNRERFRRVFD